MSADNGLDAADASRLGHPMSGGSKTTVTAFERVMIRVEELDLRVSTRRHNDAMVSCPMVDHDDASPSFHISDDPENGKVLLWCFGCEADYADLAQSLGLNVGDLYDVPGVSAHPGARQARRDGAEQRRGERIATDALFQEWLETLPGYWRRRARELAAAGCELEALNCVHHAELLGGMR